MNNNKEWKETVGIPVGKLTLDFMSRYNNEEDENKRKQMKEEFIKIMKRNDLKTHFNLDVTENDDELEEEGEKVRWKQIIRY